MIVQDAAEVYVRASEVAELVESYALDEDADRPNAILHVVDDEVWPFDDQQQIASWPVVAVDLLDADDERSQRAGCATDRTAPVTFPVVDREPYGCRRSPATTPNCGMH